MKKMPPAVTRKLKEYAKTKIVDFELSGRRREIIALTGGHHTATNMMSAKATIVSCSIGNASGL